MMAYAGGMDLRVELSCASRVGELETATQLLRHKIRILAGELVESRSRISELEMEVEEKSSALEMLTRDRESNEGHSFDTSDHHDQTDVKGDVGSLQKLNAALRTKASAETELAACRARLWEAQQLAETRAGDLAGVRGQLKDKAHEVKATASRHAAALAALEKDRQAMSVELNISKARSKSALAAKNNSLQELTAALQSSQQQVTRLRQALQAGQAEDDQGNKESDSGTGFLSPGATLKQAQSPSANASTLLALESAAAEATALRQAYEAAGREAREALDEATAAQMLLSNCTEELHQRETQLRQRDAEVAELRARLAAALDEAAQAQAQAQAMALTVESATRTDAAVSTGPIAAVAAAAAVNSKEELAVAVERHRHLLLSLAATEQQNQGNASNASNSSSSSSKGSFGWIGRARSSRDAYSGQGSTDTGSEGLRVLDISVEHPDSDDDLTLPSLDEHDHNLDPGGGAGAVATGAGAGAATSLSSSSLSKFPVVGSALEGEGNSTVVSEALAATLTVSMGALLALIGEREDATSGSGTGDMSDRSRLESRLQAERDNLQHERDSYREEIMCFLEIDAALSAGNAPSSPVTAAIATPVGSPSKADRSGGSGAVGTPSGGKRVYERALIASSVAVATSAVASAHSSVAATTPKRTMAIVRGFAESNGRLQAKVMSLVQQLEDSRLLLQRARQSEQTATLDLLRAEEHNQQLTRAMNLALAAHKD